LIASSLIASNLLLEEDLLLQGLRLLLGEGFEDNSSSQGQNILIS